LSYTLTAWASGRHRSTGDEQAVRIQVKRAEYDVNEEFGLRSEASGLYRRTYGDWAETLGSTAMTPDGSPRPRYLPPSELREPGEYTVPEEAVPPVPEVD
jgi:hypothetical protein